MIRTDVYLWRDAVDTNQFWIGIKTSDSYCGWMPTFIDAINECFGAEAYEQAKKLRPGEPQRVILKMAFVP